MKKEQYDLRVFYKGAAKDVQVNIHYVGDHQKISAMVDGHEIVFRQDEYRDGLRPVMDDNMTDPQLCYLIGTAICDHRNNPGTAFTAREDFLEDEY